MRRSVLLFKDYEVHSVTSCHEEKTNANIAVWAMQSAMRARFLTIAFFKTDHTIQLVKQSGIFNLNLLALDQVNLVNRFGKKHGFEIDKLKKIPHALDERGCPYLVDSIGFVQCEIHDSADSGDHEIFTARILKQKVLNESKTVLTQKYLKEKGYVR